MTLLRDLTGQRFARLLVLQLAPKRRGQTMWHCRCDCGREKDVPSRHMTAGNIVSCGCWRIEKTKENGLKRRKPKVPKPPKPDRHDISGLVVGRLRVIEREVGVEPKRGRTRRWRCECVCGQETFVVHSKLTTGHTQSCGCLNREGSRDRAKVILAGKRGQAHPRWNPELADEDRKYARCPEHQAWSKQVLRRDKWRCVACGVGGSVHAHHLRSYRLHPEIRSDLNNGATVCPDCHRAYHSHVGRSDFTRESFFQFFRLSEESAA